MAIKHYIKSPMTKIKMLFFNEDRGVWEKDDRSPIGHSGKLQHTFVMAVGVPLPLAIPAGFRAVITRVQWAWIANPALADVYYLRDALGNDISLFANSNVLPAMSNSINYGNGSGVIGIASQGNLNVASTLGNWGACEINIEYYLVRIV